MFKIKKIAQSPRTFDRYNALLEEVQGILGTANTVMVNNGLPEASTNGSYYPSKVTGPKTIQSGEEAIYEVTGFSLYNGKKENKEDLVKDKTKFKWIFHMPDVEIKNNLLKYFELCNGINGRAKRQADSKTDFMDIADPKKRTEAIMKHGITYVKIGGDETNQKTKLTVKFSKWLDGYNIHIEAYRRNPDIKKEANGSTVATTVKAPPEITEGYWTNDKREKITNKTVGYKDTVYMCVKTLGMSGREIISELWEEGISFMGNINSNDETICMNEDVRFKITERCTYKKLVLPDQDSEDYKKQREGIWESDPLELFYALPSERQTRGYQAKFGRLLYLSTKEKITAAYFAKQTKQQTITDATVQDSIEKKQEKIHTVKSNESLSKIAEKYGISNWEKLGSDNKIYAPWTLRINQEIILPDNTVIPKETTTTTTKKEETPKAATETVYERIETISIGSEVWLVVESANLQGKKCSIEIYEKAPLLAEEEKPLTILKDDTEVTKLENLIFDDSGQAKVKIKLRKKSEAEFKKQKEEFKDDKVAKLYLKVTSKGEDKRHELVFLEGEEFEVKKGNCCIEVTPEMLKQIFTDSKEGRRKEVSEAINKHKCKFKINNINRLSHFIGQIGAETGQLNQLKENYNYSAKTIYNIFLRKVLISHPTASGKYTFKYHDLIDGYNADLTCEYTNPTTSSQKNHGHKRGVTNPIEVTKTAGKASWSYAEFKALYTIKSSYVKSKSLFDYVYGCRMDNGNKSTLDGSDYFGVGFIHLTGKNKYKLLNDEWKKLYPKDPKDFMNDDISLLKTDVDIAMRASMIIWIDSSKTTNTKCDGGITNAIITSVTQDVNGGDNGLDDRKKYTKKAYEILSNEDEK